MTRIFTKLLSVIRSNACHAGKHRLLTAIAIAGASALVYLPMNSNADIVNVGVVSGNSNISGSNMKISHKSGGEEDWDDKDLYWDGSSTTPPGSQEQDKFLRVYSDQDRLMYDEPGYYMSRDNRGLTSREEFPIRFDSVAKESEDEGIFDSIGNFIEFYLDPGANWNPDGSGIQDYAYELNIWGNNDESNPYFTESTANNGGYGIRHLIDNNSGRSLGNFDLSSIGALTDGSTSSVGGADWGSLTLTPSESIYDGVVPEPGTGLGLLVLGAGAGLFGGRRSYSKKNRR